MTALRALPALVCLLLLPSLLPAAEPPPARVSGGFLHRVDPLAQPADWPYLRPLAGGPIRAMFVVPWGLGGREVQELAARLDLEFTAVTAPNADTLAADPAKDPSAARVEGTSPDEKRGQFMKALALNPQVIVLGNFKFEGLPPDLQEEVLSRVEAGTGLVITYNRGLPEALTKELTPVDPTEPWRYVASAFPLTDLRFYPQRKWSWPAPPTQVSFARLGLGRVAAVDFRPELFWAQGDPAYGNNSLSAPEPFSQEQRAAYRYHLALPARLLLWAAGHLPAVTVSLPQPLVLKDNEGELPVTVTCDTERGLSVVWVLRDREGHVQAQGRVPLSAPTGVSKLSLKLPFLPGGTHWADVWIKEGTWHLDWASTAVRVPVTRLANFAFDSQSLAVGQTVAGKVVLQKPWEAGYSLGLALRDSFDRDFQTERLTPTAGASEVPFSFTLRQAPSLNLQMIARLRDSQGRLVESLPNEYLWAPGARTERFPFVIWGHDCPGLLGWSAYRNLRDLIGLTAVLHWPSPQHNHTIAAANLRAVSHIYPFCIVPEKPDKTRWQNNGFPFCAWFNAEDRPAYLAAWKREAGNCARYGMLSWSLGDEINLGGRDVCYQDWVLPAFREYLQQAYGTLEALNAEWGTKYTAWEEVKPLKSGEVVTQAQVARSAAANDRSWQPAPGAPEQTQVTYAPYLDHRLFVEREFGKFLGELTRTVREADPGVRHGFEGAGNLEPYYGLDPQVAATSAGTFAPYEAPEVNELIRSFAPRELLRGNWWGGYVHPRATDPRLVRAKLWRMLVAGASSLWWFATTSPEGLLNTDLSPADYVPVGDLRYVMDGLGEWLAGAGYGDDPVALYYSRPSVLVSSFEEPWGYSSGVLNTWQELLWDLGYQPRYVSTAQALAGELSRYKVLILPHVHALSAAEAEALRAFVAGGGTLIADLRPGVTDEHGTYLAAGRLDDLFGVKRSSTQRDLWEAAAFSAEDALTGQRVKMAATAVDRTVAAAGAKAVTLPEGPAVLLSNTVEKGRALLLNFRVQPYLETPEYAGGSKYEVFVRHPERAEGLPELLGKLLTGAGVAPGSTVTDADGKPVHSLRRTWFTSGGVRMLGLARGLQEPAGAEVLKLKVARGGHVYDPRAGKYLGQASQWQLALRAGDGAFLSVLPYRVEGLTLKLVQAGSPGGEVRLLATLTPRRSYAGHLLQVAVKGPEGSDCPWWRRFVAPGDLAEVRLNLPLAANEGPGAYTVMVRDVLTGLKATAGFRVAEPD